MITSVVRRSDLIIAQSPKHQTLKRSLFHSKAGQLDSVVILGPVWEKTTKEWKWPGDCNQWMRDEDRAHLLDIWKLGRKDSKKTDTLVHFNPNGLKSHPSIKRLAVVNNPTSKTEDESELNMARSDSIRTLAAQGVKALRGNGATNIGVDVMGEPQAAAEGGYLGLYKFEELMTGDKLEKVNLLPFFKDDDAQLSSNLSNSWDNGCKVAHAQNWARILAETPSNLMTPTIFANRVIDEFKKLDNADQTQVIVRDKAWAESQKMGCFLGVAQGSNEPLKFVEIHYKPSTATNATSPLILVGKGITFDSGGISIKPSAGMGEMKGDMSGAASVAATLLGMASLKVPVHAIALIPLCENMPSGVAIKPGDVLTSANGKTVEVDNTDAEGRLILADALHYANTFNPHTIIDVATLTGAMGIALGNVAFGVFSNSKELWKELSAASHNSGERCWRMPLFPEYKKQIKSNVADLKNTGGRGGGACTAAMFLKEFVTCKRWSHLDIAPVMSSDSASGYLPKGMTGIPVRTLIQYATKFQV